MEAAFAGSGIDPTLRRNEGYDHSYEFTAWFMNNKVARHAAMLAA